MVIGPEVKVKRKWRVAQPCPTLCDPMVCSLPGIKYHPWDFLGKNTGVSCHFLLQEIFPTQGSNQGKEILISYIMKKCKKHLFLQFFYVVGPSGLKIILWASLVAQWWRICPPMQRHEFNLSSGKIPHAREQLHHVPQVLSLYSRYQELQWLSPCVL